MEETFQDQRESIKRIEDRVNEIADSLKVIAEAAKVVAWGMKDGGIGHDIAIGVRKGIFGQNAGPDSTIQTL